MTVLLNCAVQHPHHALQMNTRRLQAARCECKAASKTGAIPSWLLCAGATTKQQCARPPGCWVPRSPAQTQTPALSHAACGLPAQAYRTTGHINNISHDRTDECTILHPVSSQYCIKKGAGLCPYPPTRSHCSTNQGAHQDLWA